MTSPSTRLPVLCLLGPTASGKTDLALALADSLPLHFINLDSTLIYRGMDIGTAKPSAQILEKYPHALVNLKNPDELYSVGEFIQAAQLEIQKAHQSQKLPVFVGGSMMYYQALSRGLSEFPEIEEGIREKILTEGESLGWPVLHERLKLIDPSAYHRIKPHDMQRITRALEVYMQSGKSLSSFWEPSRVPLLSQYNTLAIALMPASRPVLHEKIAMRAKQMLDAGLIQEVRDLIQKWPYAREMPSMRSVGYRQVLAFLSGEISSEQALLEQIMIATRQLAKHQITWLRKFTETFSFESTSFTLISDVMDFILARNLLSLKQTADCPLSENPLSENEEIKNQRD